MLLLKARADAQVPLGAFPVVPAHLGALLVDDVLILEPQLLLEVIRGQDRGGGTLRKRENEIFGRLHTHDTRTHTHTTQASRDDM